MGNFEDKKFGIIFTHPIFPYLLYHYCYYYYYQIQSFLGNLEEVLSHVFFFLSPFFFLRRKRGGNHWIFFWEFIILFYLNISEVGFSLLLKGKVFGVTRKPRRK